MEEISNKTTKHYLTTPPQKKNAEKDDFDQRLECAAPKRWSKYTTVRAPKRECQKRKNKSAEMRK